MNEDKLYDLIEDFYGYKGEMRTCDSGRKEVTWFLYESLRFRCRLNGNENTFSICLEVGHNGLITRFLGKTCSGEIEAGLIKESLQIIDDYCRLRLPDKFLEAYDQAYVLDLYED